MTACHLCAFPLDDADPLTALLDHVRTEHPSEFAEVVAQMFEQVEPEDFADHVCDTGNFDRTVCPEPCGAMHSYCDTCGKRGDPCAFDEPEEFGGCGE